MSTFDEALATILAEHKALRRENELLKKKLAEAEETIAIIKRHRSITQLPKWRKYWSVARQRFIEL